MSVMHSCKHRVNILVVMIPLRYGMYFSVRLDSLRLLKLPVRRVTLNVTSYWSRSKTRWRHGGSTGTWDLFSLNQIYSYVSQNTNSFAITLFSGI